MTENPLPNDQPRSNPPSESDSRWSRFLTKWQHQNKLWLVYLAVCYVSFLGVLFTLSLSFFIPVIVASVLYILITNVTKLTQHINSAYRLLQRNLLFLKRSIWDFYTNPAVVRPQHVTIMAMSALVALCLCAYAFRPIPARVDNLNGAFLLFWISGALLSHAAYFSNRLGDSNKPSFEFVYPVKSVESPVKPSIVSLIRGVVVVFAIVMLALEGEISGNRFGISILQRVSSWLQGGLFWGGIVLLVAGLSGTLGIGWARRFVQCIRQRDLHLFAFVGIVLLAFAIRCWQFSTILPVSTDDGINIPQVLPFLEDNPTHPLVAQGAYQATSVFAQLMSISVRLLGYNFSGARAVNIVFGTLNVIAVYLLAAALFDKKMGLISALILATLPVHIHFSRLALLHLADATFGTFTIAFLTRAMRHNRRADWVLAGASLGLTQYFFEAGRLFFPPLILLWLAIIALFNLKRLRLLWRGFLSFFVTACLVAMPVFYSAWAQHAPITPRMTNSGTVLSDWIVFIHTTPLTRVMERVMIPFLAYIHLPERTLFYAGNQAMIQSYLVPIFLAGAFYLIWWWRKPTVIVMLWLLGTAGANMLLQDSLGYARFIVGFPAVAITLGAGIYYALPLLLTALRNRQWVFRIVVVAVLIVAVIQVNFYFNEQVPAFWAQVMSLPSPDPSDAAIRMADMPPGTQAYLISDTPADVGVVNALLGLFRWKKFLPYLNVESKLPSEITLEFISSLPLDKDYAFFVEPNHESIVVAISRQFELENPQYSPNPDIPLSKGFVLYYAPLKIQH